MKGSELLSFQIISAVGEAKSSFVEAIQLARKGDFVQARKLIASGDKKLVEGHRIHAGLLHEEAKGEDTQLSLLLVHAEDQLMNAETCRLHAEEFVYLYELLKENGIEKTKQPDAA